MLESIVKGIKPVIFSFFPSCVLGFLFYILVGLTQGMEKIILISLDWFGFGVVLFIVILSVCNNGRNIFARFLIYSAYELWLMPFASMLYMIFSMGQANDSIGAFGAVGAGVGGFFIIILAICGAFVGLVLYLIGNSILNKSNHQKMIHKCKKCKNNLFEKSNQCSHCDSKTGMLKASGITWGTIVVLGFFFIAAVQDDSSHQSKHSAYKLSDTADTENISSYEAEPAFKKANNEISENTEYSYSRTERDRNENNKIDESSEEQFELGMIYYEGNGVEINKVLAETWFRQAAESGYVQAQYILGKMYIDGDGIPIDRDEGFKWLNHAANQGYPLASATLGMKHAGAFESPRDNVNACMWLLISLALPHNNSYFLTSEEQDKINDSVRKTLKVVIKSSSDTEIEKSKDLAMEWLKEHNKDNNVNLDKLLASLKDTCSMEDLEIISFNPSTICIGGECIQFKFVGELRNNCTIPIGADVQIIGRDSNGVLIDSITGWPASMQNIAPGGTVPINFQWMEYNQKIKNFEIKVIKIRQW